MGGLGVYPGSFNPPTAAHLAVAASARRQAGLERVDLAMSRLALGKSDTVRPCFEDRLTVLREVAASRPWLGVVVTDAQLIADIAAGYDVVIMGADKWAQVMDPAWYGSDRARDEAVARLPRVLVAARAPFPARSSAQVEWLDVPEEHLDVSSTAARTGRRELMVPEAARFDEETGAWSEPDRYERWAATMRGL
jgi:nicotinic acid mononucleotide adenylyltransferase